MGRGKLLNTNDHLIAITSTKDYDLFEFVPENRSILKHHVKRQKRSLEENGWLPDQPMLVVQNGGGKWLIIDGQHRFLAAKELGIEVFFCEKSGDDPFKSIQIVHTYSRTWKTMDYVHHWSARGAEAYIMLQEFMTKHDLRVGAAISVLMGQVSSLKSNSHLSAGTDKYGLNIRERFKHGDWQVRQDQLDAAEIFMSKIEEFCSSYPHIRLLKKENRFISALMLLMNHRDYDHDRMMHAIQRQSTRVVRCPSLAHYLDMLLQIYNDRLGVRSRRLDIDLMERQNPEAPENRDLHWHPSVEAR